MHVCKIIVGITLSFLSLHDLVAQKAEEHVYRITISSSPSHGEAVLTGFQLKSRDYNGIVTCLHGVVNQENISATYDDITYSGLQVKYVDIEHDMVLLYSKRLTDAGLEPALKIPEEYKQLKVMGYPAGMIGLNKKTVRVGSPAIKRLGLMVPSTQGTLFTVRNSPSPKTDVLYIEGAMVPGHSGAPLMDDENRVYGVIFGGVKEGAADISWAIPIGSLKWTPATAPGIASKLKELSDKKYVSLFSSNEFVFRENTVSDSSIVKAIKTTGTWKLTMANCYTLLSDGSPQAGHWSIGGLLSLTQAADNTITGKYTSRNYIHCSAGDVSGRITGNDIELTITCTNGSCFGSGFFITGKITGNAIRGKDRALDNRPPKCMTYISDEVTLERQGSEPPTSPLPPKIPADEPLSLGYYYTSGYCYGAIGFVNGCQQTISVVNAYERGNVPISPFSIPPGSMGSTPRIVVGLASEGKDCGDKFSDYTFGITKQDNSGNTLYTTLKVTAESCKRKWILVLDENLIWSKKQSW